MEYVSLDATKAFDVIATTRRSQIAEMVLAPGERTGGPDNRHAGSDQWMIVVSGRGEAVVEGAKRPIEPGHALLIEAGEAHEIRNAGPESLRTLNIYAPPAY